MSQDIISGMLREGLYTRIVGRRIVYFQQLSSTMDEATRMALDGTEDGTVVLADEQTAGRGRFQRTWVSPQGNLYFSIVLRPSVHALQYLSILSGVAVVRAIRKATTLTPTIKWPNDIRVGGKKVCGILVENSFQGNTLQHATVGIGINVTFDPSTVEELAETATGLNIETGTEVDRKVLLRHLLQEMDRLYISLREGVPSASQEVEGAGAKIVEEWRGLLETLGKQVEVRWRDDVYSGYAEDVDEVGQLILRVGDGTLVTLPAGEVTSHLATGDGPSLPGEESIEAANKRSDRG